MSKEEIVIPENLLSIINQLRDLESQYADISYRAGTNGERGLYQKRKSVLAKISKLRDKFASDEFRLVYSNNWPNWFVAKKD